MKMSHLFTGVLLAGFAVFSQAGFAQTSSGTAAGVQNGSNEKAIMAYYTAFEKNDWNLIHPVLADGFTFSSPMDDHIDIMAFKERCCPNAGTIHTCGVDQIVIYR